MCNSKQRPGNFAETQNPGEAETKMKRISMTSILAMFLALGLTSAASANDAHYNSGYSSHGSYGSPFSSYGSYGNHGFFPGRGQNAHQGANFGGSGYASYGHNGYGSSGYGNGFGGQYGHSTQGYGHNRQRYGYSGHGFSGHEYGW